MVNVADSQGKRLSYFATNSGATATSQGNFRIGCFSDARHIFLTTGQLQSVAGSIPADGFADIELYDGKTQIELKGRFAYIKENNAINFLASGIDKDNFSSISNRLMSGTDKLGFRIREGSREKPGFMFAGEVLVGAKAPAAVADALRHCGFM